MSKITFQCYNCNQTLKVGADKAGKKAKCVNCSTILTIPVASDEPAAPAPKSSQPHASSPPADPLDFSDTPAAPSSAPQEYSDAPPAPQRSRDDDYDDGYDESPPKRRRPRDDDDYDDEGERPRKRRRSRDDDDYDDEYDQPRKKKQTAYGSWNFMRLGFFIAFISMMAIGGGLALEVIGNIILAIGSFSSGSRGLFTAVAVICKIGVVIKLGGFVGTIVGYVFWIFGKNKNNSLVWAIVTVSVGGVALILLIITALVPVFGNITEFFNRQNYGHFARFQDAGRAILSAFGTIFIQVTWMMSAFYMWSLAKYLRDKNLVKRQLVIIIMCGASAGYQLIWPLIIRAFQPSSIGSARGLIAVMWIMFFLGIGLMGTIINMLIFQYRNVRAELRG